VRVRMSLPDIRHHHNRTGRLALFALLLILEEVGRMRTGRLSVRRQR
jgi:hypothetical protein